MPAVQEKQRGPFSLVVTGEAEFWRSAVEQIVGPKYLITRKVHNNGELIEVIRAGQADAAVLDDSSDLGLDVMQLLRQIRRINVMLPVVIVTAQPDRRRLEDALRLAAFSVISRPLRLEELLRQIQRMMIRLDMMLKQGPMGSQ